jgi:hypothetical protein
MTHRAVTVSLSGDEYDMLLALQSRLRKLDVQANNSTPFRAGIRLLAAMADVELMTTIGRTPVIPRGPRPIGNDATEK